ncbi:glycosyltransferase [Actinocorallia libanotica]|uniref:Glycosyltransferase 2-like domain-containing protein n=1 Tax=Actinocorallia libanotica TaxID=46162 RepID=A0ABP4CDZ2_9ACTN
MRRKASRWGSAIAFAFFGYVAYRYATPSDLGPLGYILLGLLTVKLVLALIYTPKRRPRVRREDLLDAAVIVPIYNEDPEILRRCLMTIAEQSEPPRTVMVVDDGSSSDDAARVAESLSGTFIEHNIRLLVLRQPRNMGKREALAGVSSPRRTPTSTSVSTATPSWTSTPSKSCSRPCTRTRR